MKSPPFAVVMTAGAEHDLATIKDYLSANASVDIAEAFLDKIVTKAATLAAFPHRGGVTHELRGAGEITFRELSVPPYRLIYRTTGNTVFVTIVAHARRDLQALLAERLQRR